MARLIDGTAADVAPLEHELIVLTRKSYEQPSRLGPSDLESVRKIAGEGALDYALVTAAFHYINRIADLLHVPSEALPRPLRRFEFIRRLGVRLASLIMGKMDLRNRDYPLNYEEALHNLAPIFKGAEQREPGNEFAPLKSRPKLIEVFQLALEERDALSSLDRKTLAKVHRTVEAALPACIEEAEGFHARPDDPVEAFTFVGTRYAYRTTQDMIDALKKNGYNDLGILDLAIAVAEANQWARLHRLLGLKAELFYVGVGNERGFQRRSLL